MNWMQIYFMIRVCGIVLVFGLVVLWLCYMIYKDFFYRDYKSCTINIDNVPHECWYVVSNRTSGSQDVVLYVDGWPRKKAKSKCMVLGTLTSVENQLNMRQGKGEIPWI